MNNNLSISILSIFLNIHLWEKTFANMKHIFFAF